MVSDKKVVCIGGGPAGLTAAYLLSKKGIPVTVLETNPQYLEGISKTVLYKEFYCDIGGHKFFSKSTEVTNLWNEILDEGLKAPQVAHLLQKKFFDYPLKPTNALLNLGIIESVFCVLSYLNACLFPVKNPSNFEQWVSNWFGRRLFSIFFRSTDEDLIKLASDELIQLGLAHPEDITDGFVVRQKKAYPVYGDTYVDNVDMVRREVAANYQGLYIKDKQLDGKIIVAHRSPHTSALLPYLSEVQFWYVDIEDFAT